MAFSITDPEELRRRREALWGPDQPDATSRQGVLNDWDLPPSPMNQAGPVASQPMTPSAAAPIAPSPSPYPAGAPTFGSNRGQPPAGVAGSTFATPANTPPTQTPLGQPTQPQTTTMAPSWNAQDPRGSFAALVAGKPANSQTLLSLAPQLAAAGITIEPANAAGASHKIRFPDGRVVRVGNYFDGGGTPSWGWVEQPRPGAGGGSPLLGQTGNVGAPSAGPANDPELTAAVRAQLLRLMGPQGPIDVNADPRAAAYRRARQRGAGDERARLAERAAFTGLNLGGQGSGAFETGVQGIQEGASEDIAGYEADLAGEEVQARRQQLMQGLELAVALGARTEANALQRELANLDNTYRYAALGEQGRQWNDAYGLDRIRLQKQADRDAVLFGWD